MSVAPKRRIWRRSERWWWIVAFVAVSVLLHVGAGLGARALSGHDKEPGTTPKSDEIEISLGPADSVASAPKVEPTEKPAPKIASAPIENSPQPKEHPRPAKVAKVTQPQFTGKTHIVPPVRRESATAAPRPTKLATVVHEDLARTPVFKPVSTVKETPPQRVIAANRVAAPLPVGRLTGIQNAATMPVAVVKPDRVASLATRKIPLALGSGGAKSDDGAETPAPVKTAEKIDTMPEPDKTAGSGAGAGKSTGAGVAEAPGDGRGATVGEPRISVTRGIPFGDITGLNHLADPRGGGALGTLGVSGGGTTGQPFRLQLARQSSSDVGGAPEHIVYVLDVSGSMNEDGKILKARAALHKAVGELLSDDQFTFITFSDKAHAYSDGLKRASNFYVSTMETNFDLTQPNGETNLSQAIDMALAMDGVAQIFLMSDGEPTVGITDFDELSSHIRVRNVNHVHITTFALGTGEQFEGIRFLKRIAAENGGQYRYVDLSPR